MSDNAALDTGVKNRKPSLIAYQVRDAKDGDSYWDRVGIAWSNRDGGFTVQLHSIPLDGRIVADQAQEQRLTADQPGGLRARPNRKELHL